MEVCTIGFDVAKNVIQLHGVDARGEVVLRKRMGRAGVLAFFARLRPTLVGIEACGGSHEWARRLIELGHEVRFTRVRRDDDAPLGGRGRPVGGEAGDAPPGALPDDVAAAVLDKLVTVDVQVLRVVAPAADDRLALRAQALGIPMHLQRDAKNVPAADIADGSELIVTALHPSDAVPPSVVNWASVIVTGAVL